MFFSIKNLNPLFRVLQLAIFLFNQMDFIITGHYPEVAILVFGVMVFSPCLYFRKVSSWFLNALLPTLNINICHHHEQNISVSAVSSSISVSSHKHSTEYHGCNWRWFWQKIDWILSQSFFNLCIIHLKTFRLSWFALTNYPNIWWCSFKYWKMCSSTICKYLLIFFTNRGNSFVCFAQLQYDESQKQDCVVWC